jgi:hypothetical protein
MVVKRILFVDPNVGLGWESCESELNRWDNRLWLYGVKGKLPWLWFSWRQYPLISLSINYQHIVLWGRKGTEQGALLPFQSLSSQDEESGPVMACGLITPSSSPSTIHTTPGLKLGIREREQLDPPSGLKVFRSAEGMLSKCCWENGKTMWTAEWLVIATGSCPLRRLFTQQAENP